jgi:hypothetical protein
MSTHNRVVSMLTSTSRDTPRHIGCFFHPCSEQVDAVAQVNPDFYRLRKETVRKNWMPRSTTEICGRDFSTLASHVSNSNEIRQRPADCAKQRSSQLE